jgi:hypothetical protein
MTNDELGILRAEIFRRKYGKYAEAWKDGVGDQRLVPAILEKMLGACEECRHIENNYCQVAIAKALNKDAETLDEIIGYFTGTVARGGHYIEKPYSVL